MIKKLILGAALAVTMSTSAFAAYYSGGVTVENYDPLIRDNKVGTVAARDTFATNAAYNQAVLDSWDLITDYRNDYVEFETDSTYSWFGTKKLHNGATVVHTDTGPWHAQGSSNRGTCTVDTTAAQNTYWVTHLGLLDFSDVNDSLTYHRARTNGNNMSAASMCWLQWMVNHDVDDLATDVESVLGFDPGYYADGLTSDYDYIAYYVQLDIANLVAIPSTFIDAAAEFNVDLGNFYVSWVNANSTPAGRAYIQSLITTWNAWTPEQRTQQRTHYFEADVTEYY